MREHSIRSKFPLIVSVVALLFAALPHSLRAGEAPIGTAIREAIEDLAPETYSDYVWTFIRRGETVKIKGKGADRIVAIFGLEYTDEDADEVILTLTSVRKTAANGLVIECDGHGNCFERSANANASDRGKGASGAKSGNSSRGRGRN